MIISIIYLVIGFILLWAVVKGKPVEINGEAVYYARTQPYGYWRVGNPVIKIIALFIMTLGAFIKNPSLTLQGAAIIFIILWAPFNPRSKFQIIAINFGLGFIVIHLLSENIIPYEALRFTTEIPYIAKINWMQIFIIFITIIAYISTARAITSRDYAWLIDIFPIKWKRENFGASIYSFAYGFLRFPNVVWEIDISIRSRGGRRPYNPKTFKSLSSFELTLSLWTLQIAREIREMAFTVDYVISSRIRLSKRKTPIWRSWSATDISIGGLLLAGILGPRIELFIRSIF